MDQISLLLIAALSSFSRALINVIDRWQFSYEKDGILHASFLNNIYPLFFSIAGILIFGELSLFLSNFLSLEACALGLIIQTVAIIFSKSLKIYPIYKVSLISKISDFSIPLCIGLVGVKFNQIQLIFSGISVLICFPLFIKLKIFESVKPGYFFLILFGLTIQSIVAPYLSETIVGVRDVYGLIYFCIATIFWRAIWIFFPWLIFYKSTPNKKFNSKITLLRAFLTLLCQASFIYVISIGISIPAILTLNLTGFISIVMANLFMKEKVNLEIVGVILLTFLLGFFSLYV